MGLNGRANEAWLVSVPAVDTKRLRVGSRGASTANRIKTPALKDSGAGRQGPRATGAAPETAGGAAERGALKDIGCPDRTFGDGARARLGRLIRPVYCHVRLNLGMHERHQIAHGDVRIVDMQSPPGIGVGRQCWSTPFSCRQ